MRHRCPNCGFQHRDTDYAAELTSLDLPRRQRRLLTRLMIANGALVTKDALIDDLYEGDDEPEFAANVVQSHVSHLRRALAGTGWSIVGIRHVGYQLVRRAA